VDGDGYIICKVSQDGVVPCKYIGDTLLRVHQLESGAWSCIDRLASSSGSSFCYTVIRVKMFGELNILGHVLNRG
jgi:hypothetical protein